MMSIETIYQLNAKAARKARAKCVKPLVMTQDIVDAYKAGKAPGSIPMIGDYRPRGFKLVDTLFVDSSGFGSPSEPALTQSQFFERLRVGLAYGVVSAGQFQVYVGEFEVATKKKPG